MLFIFNTMVIRVPPPPPEPVSSGSGSGSGSASLSQAQNEDPPYGGGGGGGGSNSQVLDKIITDFCESTSQAQKTAIQLSVDSFKRGADINCAAKFLYNHLSNTLAKNYTFCVASSPNPSYGFAYSSANKSFTYSTDDMTGTAFSYMLEHEFFHGLQDARVGIQGRGKIQTSSGLVAQPGCVDVEFEQAVYHDIANGSRSAFEHGTAQQKADYDNWINSTTNNGTSYPKLNISTNPTEYNNFNSSYQSFLIQYNSIPGNPNSSTILNLVHSTLIFVFNNSNPCS